jgi:hypothetical protein
MSLILRGKLAVWIKVFLLICGHFQLICAHDMNQSVHTRKIDEITQYKLRHEGYYNLSDIISDTEIVPYREILSQYGIFWLITLIFGAIQAAHSRTVTSLIKALKTFKCKQCPSNQGTDNGKSALQTHY